jgi:hypothetical protein
MIKTAAHLHSNFSYDGKLTLPELRVLLQQHGIQCALMTEHTDDFSAAKAEEFAHACADASTSDFIFIPGFEVPYHNAHILMLGARAFVESGDLSQWRQASAYGVLAHPHRNKYVVDDTMRAAIDAVEIWNSQYDGKRTPRPHAETLLRKESQRKPLRAFAGWDLHRTEHAGGPWLAIDADELTVEAVLAALRGGKFSLGSRVGGYWRGLFDRTIIKSGRLINAALAALGLRLPKSLTASVRQKV